MSQPRVDLTMGIVEVVPAFESDRDNLDAIALQRRWMREDLKTEKGYAELAWEVYTRGHMVGERWEQEYDSNLAGTRIQLTIYDAGELPKHPSGERVTGLLFGNWQDTRYGRLLQDYKLVRV